MLHCTLVIYKKNDRYFSTFCAGAFVGKEREIQEKDIEKYIENLKKEYPGLEVRR